MDGSEKPGILSAKYEIRNKFEGWKFKCSKRRRSARSWFIVRSGR